MSETCTTCIHWTAPDPPCDGCYLHDDEGNENFMVNDAGYCARCIDEGRGDNFGRCRMTASTDGRADIPSTLAVARDAETYAATLLTHPAFRCSMWARKETRDE